MLYPYECVNDNCDNFQVEVDVDKPMAESDRKEYCEKCANEMNRVYKSFGARTSDGYKASK